MDRINIALITTHNTDNYGASLQTYAAQKILNYYGDVTIIDYNKRDVSRNLDYVRIKLSFRGLLGLTKDLLRLFPRVRLINKFKSFSKEHFKLSPPLLQKNAQKDKFPEFNVYVSGSDQIWNPKCISDTDTLDPIYFSSFAPPQSKKISHSASFGGYQFNEIETKKLFCYLNDFTAVSVREKDSQCFLQSALDRPVKHTLDPTLLIEKTEWAEICTAAHYKLDKNEYILVYSVPKLPFLKKCVEFVVAELNISVVTIDQDPFSKIKGAQHINDAGPIDYLSLFMNASFVVTDSFHGVCFATNFNIPFLTTSHFPHSNRIMSLLSVLGLTNRLVDNNESLSKFSLNQDFGRANKILANLRDDNLAWLEENIIS